MPALTPSPVADVIEVDGVDSAPAQCVIQVQIIGEHERTLSTEQGNCRVGQPQPLETGVLHHVSALFVTLLCRLHYKLEQIADRAQLISMQGSQVADLTQDVGGT